MKKLIPYLLLLTFSSCYTIKSSVVDRLQKVWPENLQYFEDGVYKSGKDTIISKPRIKYYPVYIYRTRPYLNHYYNHYYNPYTYPRPYRFQYNYPNHYSPSFNSNSIPSHIPSTPSGSTPSASPPSSSKSKGGNIQ